MGVIMKKGLREKPYFKLRATCLGCKSEVSEIDVDTGLCNPCWEKRILTKAERHALNFIRSVRNDGKYKWHSYADDANTRNAIANLEKLGLVENSVETMQFRAIADVTYE